MLTSEVQKEGSMTEKEAAQASGRFARALTSIDKQAPSLKYLGFAFWMAWNTIAFSGSFWLRDPNNSLIAENLILGHLVASVATLVIIGALWKRSVQFVLNRRFLVASGIVAALGTVFIVITREDLYSSRALFFVGSVLTGSGTTVLFMRSTALLGGLPPRRAISMISCSALLGAALFFSLNSCDPDIACVGFILLPFGAVVLLMLHRKQSRVEEKATHSGAQFSRRFFVFLASVALCSYAFELAKAFILAGMPPVYSSESMIAAQFIIGFVVTAVLATTLLVQDRYTYGKWYSLAVFALGVLLIAVAALALRSTPTASIAVAACNCFNLVVWAMLAYLVFQAEAGTLQVFGFGNAALSGGTALASFTIMALDITSGTYDDIMRAALIVLGIIVLVDLMFVFSEKQISELLVPLDQPRKAQDTLGIPERQPKQWVLTCEAIAEAQGLPEREREVFVALARGKTAQEIADRDVLSVYTVRAHIRSIYAKLDVHSKKELVEFVEARLND